MFVIIGAGNVATHMALEMQRVGLEIGQVYSRTEMSASELAGKLGCSWTTSIDELRSDADFYLFCVKDAVLPGLLSRMKPNKGIWIHTAGSVPMDIFRMYTTRYGVLYPLQTFSKNREVDFRGIPLFVEASGEEVERILLELAGCLSDNVQTLSSEKRKTLHLAAVFACNFTNHMYSVATQLLEEKGISYNVLLPLIDETAAKIHQLKPVDAQTGPAVRYDENIIHEHVSQLKDPIQQEIYSLISKDIYKEAQNEQHKL